MTRKRTQHTMRLAKSEALRMKSSVPRASMLQHKKRKLRALRRKNVAQASRHMTEMEARCRKGGEGYNAELLAAERKGLNKLALTLR